MYHSNSIAIVHKIDKRSNKEMDDRKIKLQLAKNIRRKHSKSIWIRDTMKTHLQRGELKIWNYVLTGQGKYKKHFKNALKIINDPFKV